MAVLIASLAMKLGRRPIRRIAIAGVVGGGGSLSSVVHALLLWGGVGDWGQKKKGPLLEGTLL